MEEVNFLVAEEAHRYLASIDPRKSVAVATQLMQSHQVLFDRRCEALLAAAKASLDDPDSGVQPELVNALAKNIQLACNSGWLLNSYDLDIHLKDLESQIPHMPAVSVRDEGTDVKDRQASAFMIETMRNNAGLLRSGLGLNLNDQGFLDIFNGYCDPKDIVIAPDSRVLGGGTFGVVKEALFKHRPCAVKIPKTDEATKESIREAAMLKKLNPSPHIIGVFGLCHLNIDGVMRSVTIMELTSTSLKDRIHGARKASSTLLSTRYSRLSAGEPDEKVDIDSYVPQGLVRWATKIKIARDIILGIAYMHACGIIHGDLKPGNILLDKFDNAMLCDVGASASTNSVNRKGLAYTPGYAPQSFVDTGIATLFNDVFAFGKILLDIAEAEGPPRLPYLIGKIAKGCEIPNTTAQQVADVLINVFVDFEEWDEVSLMLRDPPKIPSVSFRAPPPALPSLSAPPRGTSSASLMFDLEDSMAIGAPKDLSFAIGNANVDYGMNNLSIEDVRGIRAASPLPPVPPPPAKDDSDPSTLLKKEDPDAYDFWTFLTKREEGRASFDDIVGVLTIRLEDGMRLDVEALRSRLDQSGSGQVSIGVFRYLVKTCGGMKGVEK
ncbi:hypothetical protein HK101_001499, partial [Irineochytrium annulatum]